MAASTEATTAAKCGCCGMREECTSEYIRFVEARFGGVWVCGLCAEAVKDEQARIGLEIEAALTVHAKFREAAAVDGVSADIARSLLRLLKKLISSTPAKSGPRP